jgi:hypothetical protein
MERLLNLNTVGEEGGNRVASERFQGSNNAEAVKKLPGLERDEEKSLL